MKKILLVDDEADVTELMQSFLEHAGYTIITANRAKNALELVELEKPSVVFLDVVMPEMDGLECLKRIKKTAPETIVIMVSGLQDEGVAKEAIRYGAYDYVTKPFDLQYIQQNLLESIFPA